MILGFLEKWSPGFIGVWQELAQNVRHLLEAGRTNRSILSESSQPKTSELMKKHTRTTFGILGLALFAGASQASADVETLIGGSVTGEISAGWDSRNFYRGLWFGDETTSANVELSTEIAPNLTGSVNLFYTDVMDNGLSYSEGNIGGALSYDAGFGTFDLGFIHYRFYDGFAGTPLGGARSPGIGGNLEANEFYLTYSQDLYWGISGHMTIARDLTIDGTYGEFGLSKSFKLSEWVGLDFSATAGYSLDSYYTFAGDDTVGWTHTLITLALPVTLTETATLTPHVSANISSSARNATNSGADRGDTEVFYGASFAVSF